MSQCLPHDCLLVECLRADKGPSVDTKEIPVPDIHLLYDFSGSHGNSWAFDAHLDAIVLAFPYIGKTTGGDWIITNSGEITGDSVRRW